MNKVELHDESYRDYSGFLAISLRGSARLIACIVVVLTVNSTPAVLAADVQINGYVRSTGQVSFTNATTMSALHQFDARPNIIVV